ncbi:unnamed protein product, partial [Allacma fusca]
MEVWEIFARDSFWLPRNYTWEDVKGRKNNLHVFQLIYPILIGVAVLFIRTFVERSFLEPLGVRCGLRVSPQKRRSKKLKKFCDSGWRFICYSALWIGGTWVLVKKEWFGNSLNFWKGFPLQ